MIGLFPLLRRLARVGQSTLFLVAHGGADAFLPRQQLVWLPNFTARV